MTDKIFKKGDAVVYVVNWSRTGRIRIRNCVVYSCGKKQMVLHDPKTGKEVGHHFQPAVEQYDHSIVVHAADYSDDLAISIGTYVQAYEIDGALCRIAYDKKTYNNKNYIACMQEKIDEVMTTEVTIKNWDEPNDYVRR
jgi:hypothetical protein